MNVDAEIKTLKDRLATAQARIDWLEKNRSKLEDLPNGSFCGDVLDFDNLPHQDVIKVIRALGGKFDKEPNSTNRERVNYVRRPGSNAHEPIVRCWSGAPPPSCRIVEVEETVPEKVIPAHTVKVRKMVCKPDLAADIAIARQPSATGEPVQ